MKLPKALLYGTKDHFTKSTATAVKVGMQMHPTVTHIQMRVDIRGAICQAIVKGPLLLNISLLHISSGATTSVVSAMPSHA